MAISVAISSESASGDINARTRNSHQGELGAGVGVECYEKQLVAHKLTPEQIRKFLGITVLNEDVKIDLRRRLCGADAAVDKLSAF